MSVPLAELVYQNAHQRLFQRAISTKLIRMLASIVVLVPMFAL